MPGGTSCAVAVCKNRRDKTGSDIIYHKFPRNKTLRAVWAHKCERSGKWNPETSYVCSAHFTAEQYQRDLKGELLQLPLKKRLKAGTIPSLNLRPGQNVGEESKEEKPFIGKSEPLNEQQEANRDFTTMETVYLQCTPNLEILKYEKNEIKQELEY